MNISAKLKESAARAVNDEYIANEVVLAALEKALNEVISLLSMGAYPRFLESAFYKQLADEEIRLSSAIHLDQPNVRSPLTPPNAIERAMAVMDKTESGRMVTANSWMASFLATAETLPLGISIASARRERPGYPLVYVNPYLEKMSGYSRAELIGQSWRIMQGEVSEPEAVELLLTSLAAARKVQVVITNVRKCGGTFKNLLTLKPMFDAEENCIYFIGISVDLSEAGSVEHGSKLVEQMSQTLPNNIGFF